MIKKKLKLVLCACGGSEGRLTNNEALNQIVQTLGRGQ